MMSPNLHKRFTKSLTMPSSTLTALPMSSGKMSRKVALWLSLALLWCPIVSTAFSTGSTVAQYRRVARPSLRSLPENVLHTKALSLQTKTRQLWATESNEDTSGTDYIENVSDSSSLSWIFSLLVPLWLVYVSNQWSRSSIFYLVDFSSSGSDAFRAMNVDLNFDETQYGLLASVAFTSLFALASLAAGVASDRYNRKMLTIGSVALWSIATLGMALSSSYFQVVGWRVVMGLACAFSTPTAYTLLQERAPTERAALANSLYATGVSVGGGLAALSVLLDTNVGWRNALLAIAAFGFASCGLSAIVLADDPKGDNAKEEVSASHQEGDSSQEESSNLLDEAMAVIETPRIRWLFIGSFFRFCSGLCIGVWSAPYFRMAFPENESEYAFAQALITSAFGIASGLLGGLAADWVSSSTDEKDDPTGKKLWVCVLGSILAAPTWYFSVHSNGSFQAAMVWLAAEYLVAEVWFGPTINVLQSTVSPKIGGTAQGVFTLIGAVGNLAPSLLGFLYGQATANSESASALSDLLSTSVVGCYLISAVCFALSAQATPRGDLTIVRENEDQL